MPLPSASDRDDRLCDTAQYPSRLVHKFGVNPNCCLLDPRSIQVDAPASQTFDQIQCIGGKHGWYGFNWLWHLRGTLDRICGGPGMRGRRDDKEIEVGETLDFWRVEAYEPNSLLRLRAEMKLPGRAWLEFAVEPLNGGTLIRQTALFECSGFWGRLYWWSLYPIHEFVFTGMLSGIARRAEAPHRISTP